MDNIFVPGYPINNYWLFHAFLAASSNVSGLDLYITTILINILFIFFSIFWLAQTLIVLQLGKPRTFYLGLLIVFVYCSLNLTGMLSIILKGDEAFGLSDMLLPGADRRLHSIFPKVFHASGMTPAVMSFTAMLYFCAKLLRSKLDMYMLVIVSACGIVCLGAMPIVAPFVVMVLLGGLLLSSTVHILRTPKKIASVFAIAVEATKAIHTTALVSWLLISLALSLPLLKYVLDFTQSMQSDVSLTIQNSVNIKMTLAAQALLIPFVCIGCFLTFRQKSRELIFIHSSIALGLLLALMLILPDQNQYKLQYLLSMIMAQSALHGLKYIRQNGGAMWRIMSQALIYALIIMAFGNALLGQYFVIRRTISEYGTVQYVDNHIEPTSSYGYRRNAFYWIRDNTPTDTIVIVPHAYADVSTLFHGRLNYVKLAQYMYKNYISAADQRITELHQFYDPNTSLEEYRKLLESMQSQLPGRAFYAVVHDAQIRPEAMAKRGARLVYAHPVGGSHVYWLNPEPPD